MFFVIFCLIALVSSQHPKYLTQRFEKSSCNCHSLQPAEYWCGSEIIAKAKAVGSKAKPGKCLPQGIYIIFFSLCWTTIKWSTLSRKVQL